MPKVYRVMKEDVDGLPVVDATGKGLGVRGVPVNSVVDVDLDQDGRVIRNHKRMSVAPAWRDLPPFLVPKGLRDKYPGARGPQYLRCFTMGEGPFQDGPISDSLELLRDDAKHGLIVPRTSVRLEQFQPDLASTRDRWSIDEV